MELVKAVANKGSLSPDSIAIRADQKSHSYHQLILSAKKISNLLSNADLKTVDGIGESKHLGGARVGIVAKPSPEFVAGVLGTWFSGGVAVPLALSYPEAELLHVMNDSDITMILSTEDHLELMKAVAAKTSAKLSLLPPVPNVIAKSTEVDHTKNGESETEISHEISGDDPALVIYTSGTTGKPKGVVHTHKGVLAQVEFMPKFSVRGIWQRWRESYPKDQTKADDAVTVFTGVPTMYTRLIQGYEAMDPELQTASAAAARQLRLMMCGSSALPLPVMQQWETITGHLLLERYGMTEVTKESFIDGGFFKTGDAARVDEDGYYVILGRTNADIMKVGGYKLSALEIEAVLLEHPTISECCVLGLPDKDLGEAVCAIVIPDSEIKRKHEEDLKPALTLEELSTWAKEKLAPYKVNKKELKKRLADQV
ncbi:hypothetical protein DH2020_041280 [Rehmannia glutinosa]|uniref:4-coumarate--CoA ligase n=1 Tax=Rehmannia glutinosa TaxID=99300 RepID=A0ABR0USP4_REHGL